ncbi:restriction endonuclease subunit S [Bacillus smithii]|uniref:restriction endonuclease subunit S n=1 Tax=Bacillus smithii TaxID=1479 RepID=UPI003D1D030A
MKNQYQHTIPEGYKKTKMGIIPNEWGEDFLENVAEIRGRIGWKGLKREEYTKEGPYLIAGKHIKSPHVLWEQCDHISIERYEESMEIALKVNDIIFTKDGSLGNPAYIDYLPGKATINSTMMLVRANNEKINPRFLYHILNGKQFDQLVKEKTSGSSIPHLFQRDMKKFKVQLPTLQEQGKIASILSTWDKAIELKEKLIEQKKQQKKGLMQKLLTGEVRLPGFDGEWEQVRLGELAKLQGGYAFKSSMFKEKGIPIVRISNILPEITDYNQEFVYYDEIKISDNFMVQYGDILIAMSGATTGKVGIYKKNEIAYLNQRVGKFVNLDKSKLDYGYLYYLVTSTKFKTQLTEELATGAQPNISSKQIENFKFKIPSINEQISISKILAQFDKFISLQEKELIYLKQQKKGLMQLLLTGKVRVKV